MHIASHPLIFYLILSKNYEIFLFILLISIHNTQNLSLHINASYKNIMLLLLEFNRKLVDMKLCIFPI